MLHSDNFRDDLVKQKLYHDEEEDEIAFPDVNSGTK